MATENLGQSGISVGVLREGKIPPDQRVPLTPDQCVLLMNEYPNLEIAVQSSSVRRIRDEEYRSAGIMVVDDVSYCDILIGVKEVNIPDLIDKKTYLFFSHTHKLQPYNAKLLAAILKKRIRLIDYELLKRPSGRRVIGFGRWAGLVGAYNGIRAYGLRNKSFVLPKAIECRDLSDMLRSLKSVSLPSDFKIVLTGYGRVGMGACEVLESMKLRSVHPDDFLRMSFPEPVFTHLNVEDYNARKDGGTFEMEEFISDPTEFISTFPRFAAVADLFIAGHFWSEGSPFLFTRNDVKSDHWKTKVIADISCDIDGPVATTIRSSTIESPLYGYNPQSESECAFDDAAGITVMAVDNLPCELPRDASEGFGKELMEHVFPLLIEGDGDGILQGATQTNFEGALNPQYAYLSSYAADGANQLDPD